MLVFYYFLGFGLVLFFKLAGDLKFLLVVLVDEILDLFLFLDQGLVSAILGVQLNVELSKLGLGLFVIFDHLLLLLSQLHIYIGLI